MKKFRPSRNGHLASCNDFFWMQDSYFEGFNALIYSLIPDGINQCILSGCELIIDNEEYTITDGYVYNEQEIFYVNESSGAFEPGETPCFVLIESEGPLNPVKNAKGELVSVHLEREMELQFLPDSNDFEYDKISNISELILNRLGIEDHEGRIDVIEDDQADHAERIDQLEIDVANLEQTASDHEERISDQEVDISDHENKIDQLEVDVTNLEQTTTEQEERISDQETDIASLESLSEDHDQKIDQIEVDVTNLEQTATDLHLHLDLLSTNQGLTGYFAGDYTGVMTLINSDFTNSDIFSISKNSLRGFKRRTLIGFVTFIFLREGSSDDNFTAIIYCNDTKVTGGTFTGRSANQIITLNFSVEFEPEPTSNQMINISFIRASGNFFITPFNKMGWMWVII